MSLELSTKQKRRYNPRQLKKWHAKTQAFLLAKKRLRQSIAVLLAEQSEGFVEINLNGIKSLEDFYRRLESSIDLPDYCAVNLDALHDVLTTDVSESVQFVWSTVEEDLAQNPEGLTGLKSMLDNLPQARTDMSINYRDCSN
ncbi:MAG: barstar family protein [Alcaligenaceae bacterium]|nr:barstar family protein [Alcaligenaceae bacterium]